MKNIGKLLLICFVLASCANTQNQSWPNLREGFEVRSDPQETTEPTTRETPSQNDLEDIHDGDPVLMRLISRIENQVRVYEVARGAIIQAEESDRVNAWFTAQLELSRLNGLIDDLTNLEDPPGDLGIMADHRHSMAYKLYLENEHGKLAELKP